MILTNPRDLTDKTFHTVSITAEEEDNTFTVTASNNQERAVVNVGSVALGREVDVGIVDGEVTIDAASCEIVFDYRDFTNEYGYDELQVKFE
jgi:hypothetical protein